LRREALAATDSGIPLAERTTGASAAGAQTQVSRHAATSLAKLRAVRAEILAEEGDYEEAEREVKAAMDVEPSVGRDYALRIAEYRYTLLAIETARLLRGLRTDHERAVARIDESRADFITLLGLLAAVIAFIVAGTSLLTRVSDAREGLGLLLAFGGTIVFVFACFAHLFASDPRRWDRLAIGALGLGLVLLATLAIWPDNSRGTRTRAVTTPTPTILAPVSGVPPTTTPSGDARRQDSRPSTGP
jgi:hypothetical protein